MTEAVRAASVAQVAVARHGRLAAFRTFGRAKVEPDAHEATDATLWLLYSQTKMLTSAALWQLVDRGALSFSDFVADHLPEFAANGKGEIRPRLAAERRRWDRLGTADGHLDNLALRENASRALAEQARRPVAAPTRLARPGPRSRGAVAVRRRRRRARPARTRLGAPPAARGVAASLVSASLGAPVRASPEPRRRGTDGPRDARRLARERPAGLR
jgi:hypothetical protein